ncbi:TonB-dependent receptor [Croceibacterium ferulae]|uniref:TonB-dependent receptor n=1 Tax=Croceibacterium ferulae TaxID=1854641 RepID=UPI0013904DCF|nr:TonB-dependent receptor [Croceibacterium ferulae]
MATAEPAASAEDVSTGGDIIVTGTRRSSRLQDVPVSITAVSAETLRQQGYKSPNELQYAVPGLTYNPQLGAGFLIRGIGTQGFDYSLERAVGVVIDDVVQGQPRNLGFNTFGDVDRVEVLKGPQGTLFGKNASAGVVYVVTRRPEPGIASTEGSLRYGERNELRIDNTVNVPLSDTLTARVTGVYQQQDGYLTNLYDNSSAGDYRDYAVRAKLLWQPTADLELYLIGAIQNHKDDGLGGLATFRSLMPYTSVGWPTDPNNHSLMDFPALLDEYGIELGPDNTEFAHNSRDEVFVRQRDIQANIQASLGDFTLTSVTAYSESDTGSWFDQDYTQSDFYDINNSVLKAHQLSQELRVNSPVGGFLDYVVGAFFWEQETTAYERSAGKRGYDYPADTYFSFNGAMSNYEARIRSFALFGEANFHLSDRLTAIGGLRFTHDNVYGSYFPSEDIRYTILGTPAPATDGTVKKSNLSGKATLRYEPTSELMLYATYSRGYKAPAVGTSGGNLRMVDAESVDNFELGARTQLFDRLMTVNVTAFYEKFKNFQSTVIELGDDGISRSVLSNAPGLVTKGVELDVAIRPAADLSFGGSLSYAPTEYEDFLAPCYSGQVVVAADQRAPGQCFRYGSGSALDVDGFDSIQAPDTTWTLNAAYNPLISDNLRLFSNASYYHRSSTYGQAGNPNSIVPGYGLVNANLGIGNEDGSMKLSVYARNLFDENFVSRIHVITFAPAGSYQQYFSGEGKRTLGVRFDYAF